MGAENEKGEEAAFQKTIKPLEAPINILIRAFFGRLVFELFILRDKREEKGNIWLEAEVFMEYLS